MRELLSRRWRDVAFVAGLLAQCAPFSLSREPSWSMSDGT
jgi:hypothetical protein